LIAPAYPHILSPDRTPQSYWSENGEFLPAKSTLPSAKRDAFRERSPTKKRMSRMASDLNGEM
jgi:hypothetical protein